jgi:hypothetical protein
MKWTVVAAWSPEPSEAAVVNVLGEGRCLRAMTVTCIAEKECRPIPKGGFGDRVTANH